MNIGQTIHTRIDNIDVEEHLSFIVPLVKTYALSVAMFGAMVIIATVAEDRQRISNLEGQIQKMDTIKVDISLEQFKE